MAIPTGINILSPGDDLASTAEGGRLAATWPIKAYPMGLPFAKWVGDVPMVLVELSCSHLVNPVSAFCPFCGAMVVPASEACCLLYNDGYYNPRDYCAALKAAESRDCVESNSLSPTGWNGPDGTDAEHMEVLGRPLRAHARLHAFDDAEGAAFACIALNDSEAGWIEVDRFPVEEAGAHINRFNGGGWVRYAADTPQF